MIVRKDTDIEAIDVEIEGAAGVKKRVLIGEDEGAPNFIMRRFTIAPGGKTPYHTHSWEHEVYTLNGRGEVRQGNSAKELSEGSVVLVIPNEEHNFVNTGDEPLDFLCIIPR
ncbi:MAG: cupin domain-containing protein [Candidatus Aegiribacteria sp.]|nr:cupin domain-containing protein [Candidatus Aegiribacteria sp.]